jgi:Ca2+-transporting ATPase
VAARWASDGHRILALADRDLPAVPDPPESAEADLRLLDQLAMADPPRAESAAAVAACRRAGVTR